MWGTELYEGGLGRGGSIWAVGSCTCAQHASLSPLLGARGCGPPPPGRSLCGRGQVAQSAVRGPRSAVLGTTLVVLVLAKDRPDSLGGTQHPPPRHPEGPGRDLLEQKGPARPCPAPCALSRAWVLLSLPSCPPHPTLQSSLGSPGCGVVGRSGPVQPSAAHSLPEGGRSSGLGCNPCQARACGRWGGGSGFWLRLPLLL